MQRNPSSQSKCRQVQIQYFLQIYIFPWQPIYTLKVACRVQIWKKNILSKQCKVWLQFYLKRHYIYVYALYLRKKHVLSLSKIDALNFTMQILTMLTWSLKTYVILLHNLISMNIFFTQRSVFLYNCKQTSENK